jgi:hypothetical protein
VKLKLSDSLFGYFEISDDRFNGLLIVFLGRQFEQFGGVVYCLLGLVEPLDYGFQPGAFTA